MSIYDEPVTLDLTVGRFLAERPAAADLPPRIARTLYNGWAREKVREARASGYGPAAGKRFAELLAGARERG